MSPFWKLWAVAELVLLGHNAKAKRLPRIACEWMQVPAIAWTYYRTRRDKIMNEMLDLSMFHATSSILFPKARQNIRSARHPM